MENSVEVPKKQKIELPYDPATLILGIFLEKTIILKDNYIPDVHCGTIYNRPNMEAT